MEDRDVAALEEGLVQIWDIARRLGLDPYPTHFELVPASIMYEFGAYGLPGRFAHWSFGKGYYRMKTQYDYGLSKIYEMVINTNPSYAFLMESNSVLQNKLVIAHVFGHTDFFKNNAYFRHTNRGMVESVSLHADRIRKYEFDHGTDTVERFLDAVLSIQDHVDAHAHFARRPSSSEKEPPRTTPTSPYEDLWELGTEAAEARAEAAAARLHQAQTPPRIPPEPEPDLLRFLAEYAPDLAPWQRDILEMIRAESLYFVPQMQTKICNEGWACATGESLVLTEQGFMRFDQLHTTHVAAKVATGEAGDLHTITDHHCERQVPTIRITTHRGLTIEGADKHRLLLADGTWAYLSDVKIGDRISLATGTQVWPQEEQPIHFTQAITSATLEDVARIAGVSSATVIRHRNGRRTERGSAIALALETANYSATHVGKIIPTRSPLTVPTTLNAELAWLLGYFVGDGNRTKSGICFTTGDDELAERLAQVVKSQLGLAAKTAWDATSKNGRWRVYVHSRELLSLLRTLGIDLMAKAPDKQIPAIILRSPKAVMSAFLQGYFDADAYAGDEVILSSSSKDLIQAVQIILLNYGILSSQRLQSDGCTQLTIRGASAQRYLNEIGFSLSRKREALAAAMAAHSWFKREDPTDVVTAIERGCADVFDITVDTEHRYVANGFVNHNSLWHARTMRELDLTDTEFIEFANLNAGVIAPHRRSINPYHLGVKILEDIERRWDNPSEEMRARGIQPGSGRAKLFEVRELENDLSLLRNYLTKDLVDELDLYLYERQGNEWVIVEKDWEKVRDGLVSEMTNFGRPLIVVENADYRRSRELYLVHRHEGRDLDPVYTEKTLGYIQQLWGRPVHLETVLDGDRTLFTHDGNRAGRTEIHET